MALPIKLINFCLERVKRFSEYLPYFTYDENEGMYYLIDGSVGFIFECFPLHGAGDSVASALNGLFSMYLPIGSSIQVSLIDLPVTELAFDRIREGRVRFKHLIEKRVELYQKAKETCSLNEKFNLSVRDSILLVSVKLSKQRERFQAFKKAVKQVLDYINLMPIELRPERLINILYLVFNPDHPDILLHWDKDIEIRNQVIFSDNEIIQTKKGLDLEGGKYRLVSLSPKQYPAEWHVWMNGVLLGDELTDSRKLRTSFMITLNFIASDQVKLRKSIQGKATMVTNQMIGPLARIIPRLQKKKESYDIVLSAIDEGNTLGYGGINLILWGKPELISEVVQTAESHFRSYGFIMQRDDFITANMLVQSLPLSTVPDVKYMGIQGLFRGKTMLSSNFASLSPIVAEWKGTPTPTLTLAGRKGQLITLDLYDNPSRNAVISGKTGSGKSFFTNELILNYLSKGAKVWMIDVGRSYYKLCKILDGEFIEFGKREFCLNPFSYIKDFNDEAEILKAIVAQMAAPTRVLTDIEHSMISQAVETVWNRKGNEGGIRDVKDELKRIGDSRADDLAMMLYDYAEGIYSPHFHGQANVDFEKDFIVLELEEFKSKKRLRSVILLLLIYDIQNKMYADREKKKLLLIDEAWDLFGDYMANAPKFIEESYRRVRKYGGSITTITQSIQDYLTIGQVGAAMLQNADFKFFLEQNEKGIEAAREVLDQTDAETVAGLATVDKGFSEIFVKSPIGSGVGRLVVDEFTHYLYTTRAEDFAGIYRLIEEEGMTVEEAIKQFVTEKDGERN